VYAGHAAVALVLKTREPRVPTVPLVLACYGPDWVELVLGLFRSRAEMRLLTHALPVTAGCAVIAALLYSVVVRRPGARYILLAWLLHWPADFFTAVKPLFRPQDLVGLDLYHLPVADFVLETGLVVLGCMVYARAFAPGRAQRRWVAAAGAALIGLQGALDYGIAHQEGVVWKPSLRLGQWRPQLTNPPLERPMHASCTCPLYIYSERAMATDSTRGVVTLVCLTCGKEKFFTQEVPAAVTCDQCGGTVFRTFATPTEPDEAVIDAAEMQARSMSYGDPSPDTLPGDLRDLDAR
jgi:hypothetical protein